LKKQLRRGPSWKQKLGVVEELGPVSRRIARKRTIVAVVGPPLQAAIYNIKGLIFTPGVQAFVTAPSWEISGHGFQDLGSQLWGLDFHTRGFQDRNLKTFRT
jgi:hypothetical protein